MDPLKALEKQSGFLRLLVYLSNKKEKTLTEILDETNIPVHQLYSSIEMAKNWKLVLSRIDMSSYPNRNLIKITEKGRETASKLTAFLRVLSDLHLG